MNGKLLLLSTNSFLWIVVTLLKISDVLLTEYQLSAIFVIVIFMTIIYLYSISNKILNLQLLFIMTFGLFIGGRFIAYFLGYEYSPFTTTFFLQYTLSPEAKFDLVYRVVTFVYFYSIGCSLVPVANFNVTVIKTNTSEFIVKFSYIVFIFFVLYYFFTLSSLFKNALQLGYASLYSSQGGEVDFGGAAASIMYTLLLFFLGYNVASKDKKGMVLYLSLFFLIAFTYLLIGARAKFGASFLLLIWLYFRNREFSLIRFSLISSLGIFAILSLSELSIRFSDVESELNLTESLLKFIYSQGITLMVADLVDKIDNYPNLAYFQLFLPAVSSFLGIFTSVDRFGTSFGNYLAYSIDPTMYYNGLGLGWSVISDIYLLSARYIPIFCILSMLFGYVVSLISWLSIRNIYFLSFFIMILTKVIYLPRASLNSVLPMLSWFVFFTVLLKLLYDFLVVIKVINKK
ncbi:O-antigen polysaccharide polymerase Wzy [Vibrio parahaemolyticus]|nr:O-antigen polysaccharide polymerase Wzy [Vibrio parahaemolyticus]